MSARYIIVGAMRRKIRLQRLSEPVNPTSTTSDSSTPVKWRSWIKRGIEEFGAAFELAGFKNAIVVKMHLRHREDPNWSVDDIRHSVFDGLPSTGTVIMPQCC